MTTISDVAQLAGVSVSTVSHVINGTKPVSASTRARVDAAIAEIDYSPNPIARTLRSGRSRSIGFVVTDTSQHVFGSMITEVERTARRDGRTLLLANSGEDVAQEAAVVTALLDHRIEALIIAPVSDASHLILDKCHDAGVAVIVIDRLTDPRFDQVGIHNREMMRSLTQHLLDLGHVDIALLSASEPVWTVRERIAGFREASDEAGLEYSADSIIEANKGVADGKEQVLARLARQPPTALIAASGLLTVGAMRAFADLDIRTPDDIAFVSFDGVSNSEFFVPRLTSFVHPVEKLAAGAMTLLERRLAGPDARPRTLLVESVISHGGSCGCRPGRRAGFEGVHVTGSRR
jgi:LacI family transcriptional regulator